MASESYWRWLPRFQDPDFEKATWKFLRFLASKRHFVLASSCKRERHRQIGSVTSKQSKQISQSHSLLKNEW